MVSVAHTDSERSTDSIRRPGAPVFLLAVLVVIAIPVAVALWRGTEGYDQLVRGYPGAFTALSSTVLRAIVDAATAVTVGAILVAMFVAVRAGTDRDRIGGRLETRVAVWAAGVWAIGSGLLVLVDAADANGVSVARLIEPGALAYLVSATYLPKAWLVAFAATTLAVALLWLAHRWVHLLLPLWLAVVAGLAPVMVGQVQVGPDHDLGSDAAALSTPASWALFGGATVLALLAARGRVPAAMLGRAGILFAVSWGVALAGELVVAWFKLSSWIQPENPTALLEAVRLGVLLLVGVLLLRARLLARRGALHGAALGRLLAAGTVLGAVFVGVGVAMTRVPPPQYFVRTTIMQNLLGFDLTAAPTPWVLLTTWRLNLGFAVLAAVAVAVYLWAVLRLRRRGDRWPLGRTVSWLLGWTAVVVATSSGMGKYSGADFAVHMTVHMTLNMLAPILLVLGGVVTLLLRATTAHPARQPAGPHEWLQWVLHWRGTKILFHPLVVFTLFVASYYVLYLTGLFEEAMSSHWAHQLMNVHFLLVGYLFYGLVIGVDRPPYPLPPIGKLGFVLAAMPFHAFFGIILMTATVPIAENLYRTLDAPWADDLLALQYVGGGVAWGGGELPLLLVIVVLGIQWARQDRREAARKDRHMDAGLDDDFAAYNRMLGQLSRRSAGPAADDEGAR